MADKTEVLEAVLKEAVDLVETETFFFFCVSVIAFVFWILGLF